MNRLLSLMLAFGLLFNSSFAVLSVQAEEDTGADEVTEEEFAVEEAEISADVEAIESVEDVVEELELAEDELGDLPAPDEVEEGVEPDLEVRQRKGVKRCYAVLRKISEKAREDREFITDTRIGKAKRACDRIRRNTAMKITRTSIATAFTATRAAVREAFQACKETDEPRKCAQEKKADFVEKNKDKFIKARARAQRGKEAVKERMKERFGNMKDNASEKREEMKETFQEKHQEMRENMMEKREEIREEAMERKEEVRERVLEEAAEKRQNRHHSRSRADHDDQEGEASEDI